MRPIRIGITFTGTRPGEKLFEELLHTTEGYDRTVHPKILVGQALLASSAQERGPTWMLSFIGSTFPA